MGPAPPRRAGRLHGVDLGQPAAAPVLSRTPRGQDAGRGGEGGTRGGGKGFAETRWRWLADGSEVRHADASGARALSARRDHEGRSRRVLRRDGEADDARARRPSVDAGTLESGDRQALLVSSEPRPRSSRMADDDRDTDASLQPEEREPFRRRQHRGVAMAGADVGAHGAHVELTCAEARGAGLGRLRSRSGEGEGDRAGDRGRADRAAIARQSKLPSVPKTSGKRGIHVFVPIARGYSHEEANAFACQVGSAIAASVPWMTMERAINKRRGRLYLDCMQNGYGKTIVA